MSDNFGGFAVSGTARPYTVTIDRADPRIRLDPAWLERNRFACLEYDGEYFRIVGTEETVTYEITGRSGDGQLTAERIN